MSRAAKNAQPAIAPADGVEKEIARIGGMTAAELRRLWPEIFGSDPPSAFSRNLLARALAYRVQEQAYGGLKPQTVRLLRAMARPAAEPPRRVKVGSIIVREHKGVLHEVMVVPEGYCWRGQIYDSLSSIARKITGVSWNGPRFFGLRSKAAAFDEEPAQAALAGQIGGGSNAPDRKGAASASRSKRAGRRSSIQTGTLP